MIDLGALVLAMVLLFLIGDRRLQFSVGKYRPTIVDGQFRLVFIFPLAATLSIVAVFRLIGHLSPDRCATCGRVSYSLLSTLYPGWVLTFLGLFGVRRFAAIQERMTRALVVVSIICGPFLMLVSFHDIVLWVRG
jgi:hypothetical protein